MLFWWCQQVDTAQKRVPNPINISRASHFQEQKRCAFFFFSRVTCPSLQRWSIEVQQPPFGEKNAMTSPEEHASA